MIPIIFELTSSICLEKAALGKVARLTAPEGDCLQRLHKYSTCCYVNMAHREKQLLGIARVAVSSHICTTEELQ